MNMRVEREFELIYFEVKILDLHTPLAYNNNYKGIICKECRFDVNFNSSFYRLNNEGEIWMTIASLKKKLTEI
jgi:hypothetical protein